MALRFAGLGSFVERSATKAAIAQASLSAARRRDARSDVAHIAPEVAAAYTVRMTRTRIVVFRLLFLPILRPPSFPLPKPPSLPLLFICILLICNIRKKKSSAVPKPPISYLNK